MKHCPEPSLAERMGKWARRNPTLCSTTSLAVGAVILLAMLGGFGYLAYEATQSLAARVRLQVFEDGFLQSQFLLNVPGRQDQLLRKGLDRSEKLLEDAGVVSALPGTHRKRALVTGMGMRLENGWIDRLNDDERQRVRSRLVELIYLTARAREILAQKAGAENVRRNSLVGSLALLEQAERVDRNLPRALLDLRARCHAAMGDADLARRDREKAEATPPRSSPDWIMLGTSRLDQGDLSGAEDAFKQAIRLDVRSFWAWFALGHCHFATGRYADATADFTACVVRGPNYPWAHFNLGLSQARNGRLLDARSSYDRALELDPAFLEARVNRGVVRLELNQVEPAVEDFRAAVQAGCRELGVLTSLAECLARTGRRREAEDQFQGLLDRDPGDGVVLVARGISRLDHDPSGARADFEAVLASDPENPRAHYGLARLIRSTDRPGAVAHLDRALRAEPTFADALQLRALERARLGDRAAVDDVDLLLQAPTAHRLYNACCALAILSDRQGDRLLADRAVPLLERALLAGFPATEARLDPDLTSLRGRADVRRLLDRPASSVQTLSSAGPEL
jgi:tetratricopeptide (TPR) repeat protein